MFCALLITVTSLEIILACAQLSKQTYIRSVITDFKSQSLGLSIVRRALQLTVYMYILYQSHSHSLYKYYDLSDEN